LDHLKRKLQYIFYVNYLNIERFQEYKNNFLKEILKTHTLNLKEVEFYSKFRNIECYLWFKEKYNNETIPENKLDFIKKIESEIKKY
jgi:hypothetical protein